MQIANGKLEIWKRQAPTRDASSNFFNLHFFNSPIFNSPPLFKSSIQTFHRVPNAAFTSANISLKLKRGHRQVWPSPEPRFACRQQPWELVLAILIRRGNCFPCPLAAGPPRPPANSEHRLFLTSVVIVGFLDHVCHTRGCVAASFAEARNHAWFFSQRSSVGVRPSATFIRVDFRRHRFLTYTVRVV